MLRLVSLGSIVVCLATGCPKNRCPERVQALKEAEIEIARDSREGLGLADLAKGVEAAKGPFADSPAFMVRARPDRRVEVGPSIEALRALKAKGPIDLCAIEQAVTLKHALLADAAERGLALELVKDVPAEDRATVLAGTLEDAKVGEINKCFEAIAHANPADREQILAGCVAEELEACGCPRVESERVFALTTVMLDTWEYAKDCVTVDATGDGSAPLVSLQPGIQFGDLLELLRPHEGKAIRLEASR